MAWLFQIKYGTDIVIAIATKKGSFNDLLWEDEAVNDYIESLQLFDIVLMGRKTYEVGLKVMFQLVSRLRLETHIQRLCLLISWKAEPSENALQGRTL